MTKHQSEETALNYPLGMNETNKISGNIPKILENHPIIICNSTAETREKNNRKLNLQQPKSVSNKIELKTIMSRLQNIESSSQFDKIIKVDLSLYQMEKL